MENNKRKDQFDKLYEDLCILHQNHPALRSGSYQKVQNSDSSRLFSFIRFSGKDSVLIVVNFANEKKEVDIHMPAGASLLWKDQFSGVSVKVKNSRLRIGVLPLGFLTLAPSSEKEML